MEDRLGEGEEEEETESIKDNKDKREHSDFFFNKKTN